MVTGPALTAAVATHHDGLQLPPARRSGRRAAASPAVLVELSQTTDTAFATYRPAASQIAQPGERASIREIVETRQEIRSQIQEQTISLIKSYLNDDPALKESLEKIYRNNPEAA